MNVQDGAIVIEMGDSMTGITCTQDVPKMNYELAFEAKRVKGNDFFATTTFPVEKSFCSFVVGGWGGGVTPAAALPGVIVPDAAPASGSLAAGAAGRPGGGARSCRATGMLFGSPEPRKNWHLSVQAPHFTQASNET